jgi:DNA ligase-1
MKPLLAANYVESKVVFPCGAQPKIDGVRGLTTEGGLTGRSLKKHKNKYTTAFYRIPEYAFLDGELAAGPETDPDLCRVTSQVLRTIQGEPFTLWHLFDCLHKHVIHGPYIERYKYLAQKISHEQSQGRMMHARLVPMQICESLEQLLYWDTLWLEMGYEGTIIRGLQALHKEGRSTVTQGQLLRIKRFIDAEAMVVSLEEGTRNENEAQTNELGRTFRTSHQENKVNNGVVGNMQCRMLADVEYEGEIILRKDQIVTVSPGAMDHCKRKHYWDNPTELVGHVIKFKFFPKGIKDKPRFPTYQAHRDDADMSE